MMFSKAVPSFFYYYSPARNSIKTLYLCLFCAKLWLHPRLSFRWLLVLTFTTVEYFIVELPCSSYWCRFLILSTRIVFIIRKPYDINFVINLSHRLHASYVLNYRAWSLQKSSAQLISRKARSTPPQGPPLTLMFIPKIV